MAEVGGWRSVRLEDCEMEGVAVSGMAAEVSCHLAEACRWA